MIHEDDDDIGYWTGIPPHGGYPGHVGRPPAPVHLCEDIVPEWPSITEAALLAHQGLPKDAEKSRRRGGYADLGNDPGVFAPVM